MKDKKLRYIYKLVISIAACLLAGLIGSFFTTPAIPTWYAALQKPPFTPPSWLFAPAWTTLYILMGISASLVWKEGLSSSLTRKALSIFGIQLLLNALWSIAFFGLKSPLGGIIVIAALWITILFTMFYFFKISRAAGYLLIPYIGWVTFASILNIAIFVLN